VRRGGEVDHFVAQSLRRRDADRDAIVGVGTCQKQRPPSITLHPHGPLPRKDGTGCELGPLGDAPELLGRGRRRDHGDHDRRHGGRALEHEAHRAAVSSGRIATHYLINPRETLTDRQSARRSSSGTCGCSALPRLRRTCWCPRRRPGPDTVAFPGRLPWIITAGASCKAQGVWSARCPDGPGKVADFSSRGAGVDVVAVIFT
jgi:hypothetical protein